MFTEGLAIFCGILGFVCFITGFAEKLIGSIGAALWAITFYIVISFHPISESQLIERKLAHWEINPTNGTKTLVILDLREKEE